MPMRRQVRRAEQDVHHMVRRESDMPGFGDVLSDAEIRAVLAYIKST